MVSSFSLPPHSAPKQQPWIQIPPQSLSVGLCFWRNRSQPNSPLPQWFVLFWPWAWLLLNFCACKGANQKDLEAYASLVCTRIFLKFFQKSTCSRHYSAILGMWTNSEHPWHLPVSHSETCRGGEASARLGLEDPALVLRSKNITSHKPWERPTVPIHPADSLPNVTAMGFL